jgi:ABC-type multidrug transport system fused ATPase/permease subunit
MMDAAQAVQMHERIVSFLYGCKTKVGERGIRLSGREEVAGGNYKDMVKDP